jgi:hypothetical protein
MKLAKLILIEINSCNALLHMNLVFVFSHLKSAPRYKFLILDTCHPDTIYLRQQECENLCTESIINCTLHLLKGQPEDGPTIGLKHVAGIIT